MLKRSGSLLIASVLASGVVAASAGAATAPLQIPGLADAKVPAQLGLGLDDTWTPPVLPGPPPPNAILGYQQSRPLSDGTTCVRGVWAVGVAVRPADRPVLRDGTLRLHTPAGSLLPKMKVQTSGVAGATRRYAGPLRDETRFPTAQGIAVLPAPRWATRAGRSLVVARVAVSVSVTRADGTTPPVTEAQRAACYAPQTAQLGPQLRALLRGVTVQRRP
jgi:hypothetical protein